MSQTDSVILMRSQFTFAFSRIVLLVVASWCGSTAPGQQGIFGEPPIAEPAKVSADIQPDPIARQQLSLAGRGNRQMADAIASLARTNRWSHVNLLLERLSQQKLNVATLATMQKRIEPSVFLKMRLSDELSEKAKSMLDRLTTAANQLRQSPDRLRAAINELDDPSTDKRLAASRTLIEGGNAAIKELVAAAVVSQTTSGRDAILKALLRLGSGGTSALRQLALYGSPTARQGAVVSLARVNSPAIVIDMLTALHSKDSSTEETKVARRYLQRALGEIPSRSAAVKKLLSDLDRKQRVAYETENSDQTVTHWSVNQKRNGIEFTKTRTIYSVYGQTTDAAARLRRVGTFSPVMVTKSLVADMGYRLLIDPDWGDPSQVDSLRSSYAEKLDADALNQALRYSIEVSDHAATVGLIRLIDSTGKSSPEWSDRLLRSGSPSSTPLVQATSSPISRVRYEAALTASRLADSAPFAGSSQVNRTLSEMLRLTDLPTAIIVETRPVVVASILQLVTRLGYHGETVQSVAQLMERLDRGGDIRLIVSKTQLSDLPPIQLIDSVRRTGIGRQLPIVFYGPDGSVPDQQNVDSSRWDGPTVWTDMPTTQSAFSGILNRVSRRRRLPPLSAIDRQRFRREAGELIAK